VIISSCWCIGSDDLNTAVWSVVGSLAFLAVVVTHVVCILLIELQQNDDVHVTLQFIVQKVGSFEALKLNSVIFYV